MLLQEVKISSQQNIETDTPAMEPRRLLAGKETNHFNLAVELIQ